MVTTTQVPCHKLAMVADMMDEFTRDENTSYELKCREQKNRIEIYERMSHIMTETIHELQERNAELEQRNAENNRIVIELYRRLGELEPRRRVRRRLRYEPLDVDVEVVDLTHSSTESDTSMEESENLYIL